jgi:hypothetical protein
VTWPIQPIGRRPEGTPRIDSIAPGQRTDRRHDHEDEGSEHRKDDDRPRPGDDVPDGDGHIDVLA